MFLCVSRDIIHASGSVKEAKDEIAYWFKESELFEYNLMVVLRFLYKS